MDKIGVVGCGLMGGGVAEVSARAGLDVVNANAGAKPDPASASSIVATPRPPSSTDTSMAAVMRGRPWTTAA